MEEAIKLLEKHWGVDSTSTKRERMNGSFASLASHQNHINNRDDLQKPSSSVAMPKRDRHDANIVLDRLTSSFRQQMTPAFKKVRLSIQKISNRLEELKTACISNKNPRDEVEGLREALTSGVFDELVQASNSIYGNVSQLLSLSPKTRKDNSPIVDLTTLNEQEEIDHLVELTSSEDSVVSSSYVLTDEKAPLTADHEDVSLGVEVPSSGGENDEIDSVIVSTPSTESAVVSLEAPTMMATADHEDVSLGVELPRSGGAQHENVPVIVPTSSTKSAVSSLESPKSMAMDHHEDVSLGVELPSSGGENDEIESVIVSTPSTESVGATADHEDVSLGAELPNSGGTQDEIVPVIVSTSSTESAVVSLDSFSIDVEDFGFVDPGEDVPEREELHTGSGAAEEPQSKVNSRRTEGPNMQLRSSSKRQDQNPSMKRQEQRANVDMRGAHSRASTRRTPRKRCPLVVATTPAVGGNQDLASLSNQVNDRKMVGGGEAAKGGVGPHHAGGTHQTVTVLSTGRSRFCPRCKTIQIRHSCGRPREAMNDLLHQKHGIFGHFGQCAFGTFNRKLSHIVLTSKWNQFCTHRSDHQQIYVGTGKGRQLHAEALSETRGPIPLFFDPKNAKTCIFYVGHWQVIPSSIVWFRGDQTLYLGMPRRMYAELKFIKFDERLAETIAATEDERVI